ncbi:hypothetical protein [Olsenella massiliensis]|uniref:hypothetical protein n=1 Tax=Olsenella massiliensis TaxID=1622075 RepID=UPI0011DD3491|nr:hypothetical protein [Olsenella massiliensis]
MCYVMGWAGYLACFVLHPDLLGSVKVALPLYLLMVTLTFALGAAVAPQRSWGWGRLLVVPALGLAFALLQLGVVLGARLTLPHGSILPLWEYVAIGACAALLGLVAGLYGSFMLRRARGDEGR